MKSAKWIVLVTAGLGLSLSACTRDAESKERAVQEGASAHETATSGAAVAPTPVAAEAEPAAEGADPVADPVADEKAAIVAPSAPDAPGATDKRAAKPAIAVKSAIARGAAPVAASNVTVNKQYYTLEIKVPAAAAAGKPAEVVVTLVPKNGRHLNHEFPTKLVVAPPAGVTVAKPTLKKADATTFTDDLATFKVSFTASDAGEKAFTGKFKFAVCTDATCDPMTEQLAFKVSVK